jgi:hypothetical protein
MAKPPRGTRGFDEARFRRDHPGEYRRRGGWTSRWERAVRAWEEALTVADELDIQPHEALLMGVRIAAFKVATHERRYGEVLAEHDGRVEDPEVRLIARESRLERALLWKNSKAAVDAGLAERLVRNVEMEAKIIVTVFGRSMNDVMHLLDGLLPAEVVKDLRLKAHEIGHRHLLAIESAGDLDDPDVPAPPASIRREPPATDPPEQARTASPAPSDVDAVATTDDVQADDPEPSPAPDPDPDVETIQPRSRPRFVPSRNQPIDRPKTFVRVTENPDGTTTTSGGYCDGD